MDAEPPLILENINVFITYVTRARVEDLETDPEKVRKALERLCESLFERHAGVDACIRYGMERPAGTDRPIIQYANRSGIPNPSDDDLLYIARYMLGLDITAALNGDDERTLSRVYLEEVPFIRLDLTEITIGLGSDFPVEGLTGKKLTCHQTAIVHRLGATAVTCWVEVPTQLTVEDTNRLIDALMERQVEIEEQATGRRGTWTIGEYLGNLADSLLAPLIRILRGEEPAPEGMIEDFGTANIVLHVGGVSMGEDNYATPIAGAEDLVGRCPRQVASLATGFKDWRNYALNNAEKNYREALAAIFQDELVMAGTRGVVIYLGKPSEPDFLKNVNNDLRNRGRGHERHHHLVLRSLADNVLQIYQLAGIVETALMSYNLRIRRYPLKIEEVERLLDLVERGLEEIDNYSLVTADPSRTVLHMALEGRGVLSLREVVERRLAHMYTILVERTSRTMTQVILVLTTFALVQTFLSALGMGLGPALAVAIIGATALTALLILRFAPSLLRVFRSLARL